MDGDNSWRAPAFRQKVLAQIEDAVKRSGNQSMMMKNPNEMENQVYFKAKSKVEYLSYVARLLVYIRDIRPQGQQQPQPTNIASQPTMTAQFPTPQINKESTLNSLAVRGATNNYRCRRCCTTRKVLYNQQLQMQQMQQPVQKTGGGLSQSAMQMPMFSGLTQQQILNQLQQSSQTQWQQPIPQQHQMQTPSMLAQAPLGVQPQSQSGHQQMTQLFNVPSNQGGSPMPVQQQALLSDGGRLNTSQRTSNAMDGDDSWRSPAFRQKVLAQIEDAVKRSGNQNMMMKNPNEMENQVYSKAKSKVEYLSYVARLLVYIRDIRPNGEQQPQATNMASQPPMGDHDYQPLR